MKGGERKCHLEWVDKVGLMSTHGTITATVGLLLTTTGPWLHHTGLLGDPVSKDQEVAMLEDEARTLEEALSQIKRRLEEIKK